MTVTSLFAGVVSDVMSVGDAVSEGDVLCRIAVFGNNTPVASPCDGTITAVYCVNGVTVNAGDALFDIDSSATIA